MPTVVVLALALAACSSSGSSTESSNGRPGIYSNRIVTSELKFPVEGMTAHQLINQYKPHWLKKRGVTSFNNPVPQGLPEQHGVVDRIRGRTQEH